MVLVISLDDQKVSVENHEYKRVLGRIKELKVEISMTEKEVEEAKKKLEAIKKDRLTPDAIRRIEENKVETEFDRLTKNLQDYRRFLANKQAQLKRTPEFVEKIVEKTPLQQRTYSLLNYYCPSREEDPRNYTNVGGSLGRFFGAYSRSEKLAAVNAFKKTINGEMTLEALEKEHGSALSQGNLGYYFNLWKRAYLNQIKNQAKAASESTPLLNSHNNGNS